MYSKKTTFRALSVAENKNFNNLVIIEEQIGFQSIFFKSVFKYFMNKYLFFSEENCHLSKRVKWNQIDIN